MTVMINNLAFPAGFAFFESKASKAGSYNGESAVCIALKTSASSRIQRSLALDKLMMEHTLI